MWSILCFWRGRLRLWRTNTAVLCTASSCFNTSAHFLQRPQHLVQSNTRDETHRGWRFTAKPSWRNLRTIFLNIHATFYSHSVVKLVPMFDFNKKVFWIVTSVFSKTFLLEVPFIHSFIHWSLFRPLVGEGRVHPGQVSSLSQDNNCAPMHTHIHTNFEPVAL